ncbi:molybdate ABC transporter ATP-binding protein ModC [Pasteurella canis]|uniref:Molybdate ABC transporter ATP-binding protein ModC n=1 Tax=Pasteurella canis TaxID=753 RepID=A0A379ETF0_9PAST|nr:molybdenum ABC transporter ATP-binding protein ModC [Pasteurella canis]SUC09685.1 molybdate ABC transporter ATP-binding protein ModC [Pasteurella canis]
MLHINAKKQLGHFILEADLTIPAQGVTAIFGLSGSGKSSLINLVSGLVKLDQGSISLNQRVLVDTAKSICLPPHQRRIGYVFQDARLFPHYNVRGNLLYGVEKFDQQEFDYIVDLLGIEHLLKRYPITLSGGEKQRVAIGRALLTKPEILLMDEPLSALDLPRKRELMTYLEKLSKQIQIPILYVTHSLDELLRLAQRVVLLDGGKVQAYDLLENIWESPLFLPWKLEDEQSAVLSLPVVQHHTDYKMTALALAQQQIWIKAQDCPIGERMRICIKGSDVSISLLMPEKTSIRNILKGKVHKILEREHRVDVQILLEGNVIWATISKWALKELDLQLEQSVFVQVKAVSVV